MPDARIQFLWVVAANVVPALIMLATYPMLVGLIGFADFAIVSISLLLIAYSQVFEFGVGRTTVIYTARLEGQERLDRIADNFAIAWAVGVVAMPLVAVLVRLAFPQVPAVPAILFPLVVLDCLVARSTIEGFGRFEIFGLSRIVANSLLTIVPLLVFSAMPFRADVLLWLLLLIKVGESVWLRLAGRRLLGAWPNPARRPQFAIIVQNLKVSVTVVLGSLFGLFDRAFASVAMGPAALGLYSVPADIISRYGIIAGSVTTVALPRMAAGSGGTSVVKVSLALLAGLGLVSMLALWVVAPPYLALMGTGEEELLFRLTLILAAGMITNSLSGVLLADLHARLVFDLPAIGHVLQLVALGAIVLVWGRDLVDRFGLVAVAGLWAGRCALDLLMMAGIRWVRS